MKKIIVTLAATSAVLFGAGCTATDNTVDTQNQEPSVAAVQKQKSSDPLKRLDAEQKENLEKIYQHGVANDKTRNDIKAGIIAGLAESDLRNVDGENGSGLFQVRAGDPESKAVAMNPDESILDFYQRLSGVSFEKTPAERVQEVQKSANEKAYIDRDDIAERILDNLEAPK